MTTLTGPIAAYIAAANNQDVCGVVACFISDAVVRDEGRSRHGVEAIQEWTEEVNRKYQPTVEPLSVHTEKDSTLVVVRVSGTFPGSPIDLRYHFALIGQKISRLEITP